MEGIDFITDAKGRKTKVIIDLEKYQDNLEDALDLITYFLHKDDPRFSLEQVKAELIASGKLHG